MLSPATSSTPTDPWQTASSATSSSVQLSGACALLALMARSQSTAQASSKTDVVVDVEKLKELKQQLADAIQKAKDAADSSGFFGFLSSVFGSDVAQIAGAVAAVAAVVATGGAAAPLVLMAVSVALEEAAKFGAQLGLDPKICAAIGLASAAVGICSGVGTAQAVSGAAATARDVELIANVAQGTASATGGALGYVAGHYQAQQMDYQADATGYQARGDATDLDFDAAIALLQQALRTEQRETTTTSAIIQNDTNTNSALANRI